MNEKVSALMDDEMRKGEVDRELARIEGDDEARLIWQRYHLIRAVMRDRTPVPDSVLNGALAESIRRRIDAEPTCIAPRPLGVRRGPRRTTARRWLEFGGGLALAASVAVVWIVGTRGPVGDVPASRDSGHTVAGSMTQWQTDHPERESDLNTMLVQHGEFSSPSGLNGLIAYAKIVSYDSNR